MTSAAFSFCTAHVYFTEKILAHLGGKPYQVFEQKQKQLERCQDVGYKAFREANAEVDQLFIQSVRNSSRRAGTPILLAIAGATAAGKTEIVERLSAAFHAWRAEIDLHRTG